MVRSVAEDDVSHHCAGTFCCEGYIKKQESFQCLLVTQLCESAGCCSKSILATRQLFNNDPERSISNWTFHANFILFSPKLTIWCSRSLTVVGSCFSVFASEGWTSLVSNKKSKNTDLPLFACVFLSHVMLFPIVSHGLLCTGFYSEISAFTHFSSEYASCYSTSVCLRLFPSYMIHCLACHRWFLC